ncbi:hypothetical protein GN958_ATG12395, partial [Phytophthora infestans]
RHFATQQKRLIQETERENAKLSDMLRSRPTQRELVTSQLEVERLQRRAKAACKRLLHSCQERRKLKDVNREKHRGPLESGADEDVKDSPRIMEERLHKRYGLARQQNLWESGIIERVGRICFDIVASFCYVLEVENVGELPSCVEKARQLSQVSTTYQEFVERIEKLLKRFDK